MAHIEDTLAPNFTGHVGPVRFVRGHGETTDPDLVEFFREDGGRYVVTDTDEPAPEDDPQDDPVDDPQDPDTEE